MYNRHPFSSLREAPRKVLGQVLRLRHQPFCPIRHRQALPRRQIQQRSFTSVSRRRRPQTLYTPSGEPVRFQAVHLRKPPFFTYRRLGTILLYGGAVFLHLVLVLDYLDIDVEVLDGDELTEEEEKWQEAKANGEAMDVTAEKEYSEEDGIFFPLTWPTKQPRTFYKGSDPEWQEFIKVAKDKTMHKEIVHELVRLVYAGCTEHPVLSTQLGKEPKAGKYWLDISFPDAPPQEYKRYGLHFGDNFIAVSSEHMSQEHHWRTMRALWPKVTFDALYATTKVMAGIQYRRMKQLLGWQGKDPFSPEEQYRHAMEMAEKQQRGRERKEVGKTQTSPDGAPGGGGSGPAISPSAPSPGSSQSITDAGNGNADKRLPWHFPNLPLPSTQSTISTDIPIAMHVFSTTLSKSWDPDKIEPPRGTFVVQGFIEVKGQRGRMLFDVRSIYDPKLSSYVAVHAALRVFKGRVQSPKGGL